jgi:hypothetical protein
MVTASLQRLRCGRGFSWETLIPRRHKRAPCEDTPQRGAHTDG